MDFESGVIGGCLVASISLDNQCDTGKSESFAKVWNVDNRLIVENMEVGDLSI